MSDRFRPILLSSWLAAGPLPAGDLDVYFSNQSADSRITLILDEASAERRDVYYSLLSPGAWCGTRRPVPVLLQDEGRSRTLEPGRTAVLRLLAAPAAGGRADRGFRVIQEGRAGSFGFTVRVALRGGFPYAELLLDPDADARARLDQPAADLVVFWRFLPVEG